ncbi:glycosyltransferase family 2 protein [Blastopirellula retiformator]|uniref:Chondroitin synthase n=1 Tax=Blastopirellula retiformator TaxID=2527970 RepID=A0A5C5V986_9BACT|nr:glycosyltransferase family 2 protein [Blastopirellula retiformator]TWT34580.1 Chondroitin synthase [Blastopirellula retiformator]
MPEQHVTAAEIPITVIVPHYNGAPYVLETLDSIRAQSYPAAEIIVVDDHSSDDSLAQIRDWNESHGSPLRILSTESNSGGPSRPTNLAIAAANSPWIAVLDQDDLFHVDRLQRAAAAIRLSPQAECIVSLGSLLHAPNDPATIGQGRFLRDHHWRQQPLADDVYPLPSRRAVASCVRHGMFAAGYPGLAFRRDAWQAIGGVRESFVVASDFHFLLSLAARSDLVVIDQPLYQRRVHGQNLSHRSTLGFAEVLQAIAEQLQPQPELLADSDLREALAWRIIESGWNVAAFGQLRLGARLIRQTAQIAGWTPKRTVQLAATPLMPIYRRLFLSRSNPAADVIARVEQYAEQLLELMRGSNRRR